MDIFDVWGLRAYDGQDWRLLAGKAAVNNLDLLTATGEALLGPLWQSELARQLGVSVRTMQRWAGGQFAIPPGVWSDLLKMLADRQAELARLQPLLEKQVSASTSSE